jgi:hypothetical protein
MDYKKGSSAMIANAPAILGPWDAFISGQSYTVGNKDAALHYEEGAVEGDYKKQGSQTFL